MITYFDRFTVQMTREEATSASHQGACEDDVKSLLSGRVGKQFSKIDADAIRAELKEYGAWDEEELADDEQNQVRITWIAAGNILHPNG